MQNTNRRGQGSAQDEQFYRCRSLDTHCRYQRPAYALTRQGIYNTNLWCLDYRLWYVQSPTAAAYYHGQVRQHTPQRTATKRSNSSKQSIASLCTLGAVSGHSGTASHVGHRNALPGHNDISSARRPSESSDPRPDGRGRSRLLGPAAYALCAGRRTLDRSTALLSRIKTVAYAAYKLQASSTPPLRTQPTMQFIATLTALILAAGALASPVAEKTELLKRDCYSQCGEAYSICVAAGDYNCSAYEQECIYNCQASICPRDSDTAC